MFVVERRVFILRGGAYGEWEDMLRSVLNDRELVTMTLPKSCYTRIQDSFDLQRRRMES